MEKIYILQDKTGYAVGATFERDEAMRLCQANGWTYRLAPFFKNATTKIEMIAGPIESEYLPKT